MHSRSGSWILLVALSVFFLAGVAVPVLASPAPVSACSPCDEGFLRAADSHGLQTEISRSTATVQVHNNGSATWTAQVRPTNEGVVNRLAENESLARAVASESLGDRYGSGIEHELISADVANGSVVIRYRTLDVVQSGLFDTRLLTYFRNSPGAYVYTDLGADELTVIAPPGTTVARGFGEVANRRMTATELSDRQDGPFVVFAPDGSGAPGLFATLAVVDALGGVIVRNLVLFVLLPGSVLVGGFTLIRRATDATAARNPGRLGTGIALAGTLLLAGTLVFEAGALPAVTGNLFVGCTVGTVFLIFGTLIAVPSARHQLSTGRLLGGSLVIAAVVGAVAVMALGADSFQTALAVCVAVLPAAVALGWVDARSSSGTETSARWVFTGLGVAVFAALAIWAPLTSLGRSLFIFVPLLLTGAATLGAIVSVPLYLLGAAGATADPT